MADGTPKNSRRKGNGQRAKPLIRRDRVTQDVFAIVTALEAALDFRDDSGRLVFNAKCGVYAFYDYDDEPIYVGQTYEVLRTRIRRHLTNQRSDAVAMHVLDPMEVAAIEVWPFWQFENVPKDNKPALAQRKATLAQGEFTVFQHLIANSKLGALLNEKPPKPSEVIELPPAYRFDVVPEEVRARLNHPDERIARRASTIANLSQVIRERDVSIGLRKTLVTQADRLRLLADKRYLQVMGEATPEELSRELERTGPEDDSPEEG